MGAEYDGGFPMGHLMSHVSFEPSQFWHGVADDLIFWRTSLSETDGKDLVTKDIVSRVGNIATRNDFNLDEQ